MQHYSCEGGGDGFLSLREFTQAFTGGEREAHIKTTRTEETLVAAVRTRPGLESQHQHRDPAVLVDEDEEDVSTLPRDRERAALPATRLPCDELVIGELAVAGGGQTEVARADGIIKPLGRALATVVPLGLLLHSGAHYYEVELRSVDKSRCLGAELSAAVGWGGAHFAPVSGVRGVGDCVHSCALRCTFGESDKESDSWCTGDVLGVAVDLDAREAHFARNGVWCVTLPKQLAIAYTYS